MSSADVGGPQAPSDEVAMLRAASGGEPAAVRWLLDEVAPIVYGFIYARVGGASGAEDLLQETLLEAVRSAHAFRGGSAASTWMCSIARRRLARYYETERRAEAARQGLHLLGTEPLHAPEASASFEAQDEVVRALGRLPATQREVLVLKYIEGLSVEEVAQRCGRSRVQVQSLLQRGRDGLRREMEAGNA
ncbi:MAG TPA: RNA polymerase sigma factor [Acidimicrobiales bacterium]|nr:RNA polymerase sigma factor [Acidimicrobiales bacterium]